MASTIGGKPREKEKGGKGNERKRQIRRGRVRKRVCGVIWKVVVGRSRDEGLVGDAKGG